MTLKIILAVDALTPNLTGIGRYTWELTRRLPIRPEIKSLNFYRNGKWIKKPETLLLAPSPKILPSSGLSQTTPPDSLRRKPFKFKWPKPLLQLHTSLTSFACKDHIFHGPNFFIPNISDIGIATVHDLSIFKYPETHPKNRLIEFDKHFRNSMARAAHLITDSEATRKEVIEFLSWSPSKITAVPLGVAEKFHQISEANLTPVLDRYDLKYKRFCLCISTLEPRKKIAELLVAYQLLPKDVRNRYPLILVGGSGWLSEGLHAEIKRLTSEGWLKYLGFVPEQDLPALYAGASVFVYPSIYEGFGLPVLEAMASGVPVVTSLFTSLPEVTQGAALLVDPDDVHGLASAIDMALCDDTWRLTAISSGLAVAKTFSWERCVGQTIDVYRSLTR